MLISMQKARKVELQLFMQDLQKDDDIDGHLEHMQRDHLWRRKRDLRDRDIIKV